MADVADDVGAAERHLRRVFRARGLRLEDAGVLLDAVNRFVAADDAYRIAGLGTMGTGVAAQAAIERRQGIQNLAAVVHEARDRARRPPAKREG